MFIDIPFQLIIQTALTGVIGWLVKRVLDKLAQYKIDSETWRATIEEKINDIVDEHQATTRTMILHYCEKYITREWVVSEELNSLEDLYSKYSKLNPDNGFINSYMDRVRRLPIREV
jgi:hypothetical protein